MAASLRALLDSGLRLTARSLTAEANHFGALLARQQSGAAASTSGAYTHACKFASSAFLRASFSQGAARTAAARVGQRTDAAAAAQAASVALWLSRTSRSAWEYVPRLLSPPRLVINAQSMWSAALASPSLMRNPAAFCGGLPLIRDGARYYMRSLDGLSVQTFAHFPSRAQIDAVLRRSMDLLQSYTSTLSASSACTALINSMHIVGKNHALMLGVVIAEALNRTTSDCLSVVLPPGPSSHDQLTFNWFNPSLTWADWADVVFRDLRENVLNVLHVAHLILLFAPVALMAPFALCYGWGRQSWLESLRESLEAAGPAFIKWGQWAATRQDMFPNDMCSELALLQVGAPSHSFAFTKQTIEASFGTTVEDLFDWLEEAPVASGSVGQVHRGKLSRRGAEICGMGGVHNAGKVVAVKVKHPGVSQSIQRDFGLMMWAANLLEWHPMLRKMRLQESLSQFAAPLREQVDLSLEANNLWRFNQNFCKDARVSLPVPLYPWVSQDVLMETFEEGMHISTYMDEDHDARRRAALADVGSSTMLAMMLVHNLIHSDLHPGNILVRWQLPEGRFVSAAARLVEMFRSDPKKVLEGWLQPHIVLLDVGMATELSADDRFNMFHLFKGFAEMDGKQMAKAALAFAGKSQRCVDPEGFQAEISRKMVEMNSLERWEESEYRSSAAAFSSVLDIVREYEVTLPGHICAVLVTTLVLEGWSSQLSPEHSVLEEVKAVVANDSKNWRERLNLTVDQLISWSPVLPSLDAA